MIKGKKRYALLIALPLFLIGILVILKLSNTQSNVECKKTTIASSTQIEPIKELFNPDTAPEGTEFYKLSPDEETWSKTQFDVDNDGVPENIFTANIAMNHTPHVLRIVKDGYVIFEAEGANIQAEKVEDSDGFMLNETIDWNTNHTKQTRYIFDGGKFIPMWFTENCTSPN